MTNRSRHLRIIWITILLFGFTFLYAQGDDKVPVEISSNKVIIDGVVYYVHMVRKGQTLYSISKAYNVPENAIIKENPGSDIALKEGQALKIPTKIVYNEVTLDEQDKYIYHIIQPGQTLYFLTQKYKISQEEIEKHNPEVKYDELQINQVIKIPKDKVPDETAANTQPEDSAYIYYRVKKKETMYSLAKRFEVTEDQIKEANEDLKHGGVLREGQIIRIPRPVDASQEITSVVPVDSILVVHAVKDTLSQYLDSLRAICDSYCYASSPVTFNIAIMLPFCTNERDIILNEDLGSEDSNDKYYRLKKLRMLQDLSFSFSEFYEGALLAIEDIKKEGVNVNLYVYDTQKDSSVVKEIVLKEDFKKMDLIIGPAFYSHLHVLYESLPPCQVNLVSPFSYPENIYSNNPVFITNPGNNILYERIADFMINQRDGKILIVHNGDSAGIKDKNLMLDHLNKHQLADSLYKVVVYNDTAQHYIYSGLNGKGVTHIVILTEDEIYLSKVIAKLNLIAVKHDLVLYGLPSCTKLMNIDAEFYHQLGFTYSSPFLSEPAGDGLKAFQKQYYQYFGSLPYRSTSDGYNFALMGYDITSFFLTALKEHGRYFQYCLDDFSAPQVSSDFQFIRDEKSGYYINRGVTYQKYTKEYEVKIVQPEAAEQPEKVDLSNINDSQ